MVNKATILLLINVNLCAMRKGASVTNNVVVNIISGTPL